MNTTTATKKERLSETEVLSFLINHAFENNFSVAFWRLPDKAVIHAILTRDYQLISKDDLVEDLPSGFIFAPFDKKKESIPIIQASFNVLFVLMIFVTISKP